MSVDHLPDDARREAAEADGRRYWAAMMLSSDVHVFEAILSGQPVQVRSLDERILKLGLRGRKLTGREHLVVDARILDAIAEAGAKAVSPIVTGEKAHP